MSTDYEGLISPPVNTTIYVGQTAVFSTQKLEQCRPRAYINNCEFRMINISSLVSVKLHVYVYSILVKFLL